MSTEVFTHVAQQVRSLHNRRTSLKAFAAASLGIAVAAPAAAKGGRSGKKAKNKCKQQVGKCRSFVTAACQEEADPQECLDASLPCCDFLRGCNAGAALDCFFTPSVQP
jgi:hypothetical protein